MQPHLTTEEIEKFWSQVDRSGGPDACWPWFRLRDGYGYGIFRAQRRNYKAHRIAFLIETGRLPEPCGLHSCDNPPCCNPNHIRGGTHMENTHDMIQRGRDKCLTSSEGKLRGEEWKAAHPEETIHRGESHLRAKLTEKDVLDIRTLYEGGCSLSDIAIDFDTTPQNIHRIVNRKTWKHIP